MALPINGTGTQSDPYQITTLDEYISVLITEGACGKLTNHIITNNNYTPTSTGIAQVAAEIDYNNFQVQIKVLSGNGIVFTNSNSTIHKNPHLFLDLTSSTGGGDFYIGNLILRGTLGEVQEDGSVVGANGYFCAFSKNKSTQFSYINDNILMTLDSQNMTLKFDFTLNRMSQQNSGGHMVNFAENSSNNTCLLNVTSGYTGTSSNTTILFSMSSGCNNFVITSLSPITARNTYTRITAVSGSARNVFINVETTLQLTVNSSQTIINSTKATGTITGGTPLTDEQCKEYAETSQYMDITEVD
jgi:hypothetical protein